MNEVERKDRRKKDTNELYRAIGKFIVKFEHVCFNIQTGITYLLDRAGLRDQNVSQILLAGITAEPLRTLFESLVCQTQTLNAVERKILKNALSRFQVLTEQRNDIVHSMWFIGFGNECEIDFSEAAGTKLHKNKRGTAVKSFRKKADDFDVLTKEAEQLAKIFFQLHACFAADWSVEKNFVVSSDGYVSVPPNT